MKQLSFDFEEHFKESYRTYYIFLEDKLHEELLESGCINDPIMRDLEWFGII